MGGLILHRHASLGQSLLPAADEAVVFFLSGFGPIRIGYPLCAAGYEPNTCDAQIKSAWKAKTGIPHAPSLYRTALPIILTTPAQHDMLGGVQALSKAEGGNKGELDSLEAEADMPLEQLLAQYGYVMGGAADPPTADDLPGPSLTQTRQRETSERSAKSSERPAKRQRRSEGNAPSSKDSENQLHSAAQASSAPRSAPQHLSESESESESDDGSADLRDLLDDAEADHTAEAAIPGKGRAVANIPQAEPPDPVTEDMDELDSGHSESEDFDSAAGSDAGEDDERTLEEEERMAGAEGAPQSVGLPSCFSKLVCCSPCIAACCISNGIPDMGFMPQRLPAALLHC